MALEFPEVPSTVLDTAVEQALLALQDNTTPQRLVTYYNPAEDYVGQSFATLDPQDPDRITAVDLMATAMLNVSFPASAVRRLLSSENQQIISSKLKALPTVPLEETSATDFQAMSDFYDTVKPLLTNATSENSNRWVTASKLVARKRPDLFPVRDRVVCGYLGILSLNNRVKDWVVFRHLMQDQNIQSHLSSLSERVHEAASGVPIKLDSEPLRLLDAALWMHAR